MPGFVENINRTAIALDSVNISNITAVAGNATNIDTVAINIDSVNVTAAGINNINTVSADLLESVSVINTVAMNIDIVNIVALSITDITSINSVVVPNIAEILLANDNAAIATTQAGNALSNATSAQLSKWLAEAEKMTSDSYATEAEDVVVKIYTSNGDGTFTATPTTEYSSLHWSAKATASVASISPSTIVRKDSSTGAVSMSAGTTAERPVAPLFGATRANSTLTAMEWWNGTSWAPMGGGATGGGTDNVFNENEYVVTTDYTIPAGKSAITVGDANGNVTINSGVTVTLDSNSRWVVL